MISLFLGANIPKCKQKGLESLNDIDTQEFVEMAEKAFISRAKNGTTEREKPIVISGNPRKLGNLLQDSVHIKSKKIANGSTRSANSTNIFALIINKFLRLFSKKENIPNLSLPSDTTVLANEPQKIVVNNKFDSGSKYKKNQHEKAIDALEKNFDNYFNEKAEIGKGKGKGK